MFSPLVETYNFFVFLKGYAGLAENTICASGTIIIDLPIVGTYSGLTRHGGHEKLKTATQVTMSANSGTKRFTVVFHGQGGVVGEFDGDWPLGDISNVESNIVFGPCP